jgi:NitT/TauT family transport system permease protein
MNEKKGIYLDFLLKYSGVIIFFVLWQAAPTLGWLDAQFVPPLSQVLQALHLLWTDGQLFMHSMVSLWRAVVGLLISIVIALPLGFCLGRWFPKAAKRLDPLFRIFTQVNPFSLMPVFIIMFGIGEIAKLAVIAWVCIWPVLFNTITGVKAVEPVLIKSALSMGISKKDLIFKILLPGAAPHIFLGIRIGAEMSFFMLIAGEMIGANAGLGWLIHNSGMNNQIPRLYAGGFTIVLIAVLFSKFLKYLQNRVFFWEESRDVFSLAKGKRYTKKMGRVQLAIVSVLVVVVLSIGTFEVRKANYQDVNNIHNHKNMYNRTGSGIE